MRGILTNRYHRSVRVHIHSRYGSGDYIVPAGRWIRTGEWLRVDKYMDVFDYDNFSLYGSRIIRPRDGCWYDCVPHLPGKTYPQVDAGVEAFSDLHDLAGDNEPRTEPDDSGSNSVEGATEPVDIGSEEEESGANPVMTSRGANTTKPKSRRRKSASSKD